MSAEKPLLSVEIDRVPKDAKPKEDTSSIRLMPSILGGQMAVHEITVGDKKTHSVSGFRASK